jgi:hypothetical protein
LRAKTEQSRRIARGSVPPPTGSLEAPALGHLDARLRPATPVPSHDDGWELVD